MDKRPKVDYAYIRKDILRMDPTMKPGDPAFLVAVALLSSGTTGPNADRLAKFMGCPRTEARGYGAKFRETGLWAGRRIEHSGWFDKDGGGVAFWCDVAVAQGLLKRSRAAAGTPSPEAPSDG